MTTKFNRIQRTFLSGVVLLAASLASSVNVQATPQQWAQRGASTVNTDIEGGGGMTLDNLSNVYVTGRFDGTNDLGLTNSSGGGQDIFVAKYNSAGVLAWARNAGGNTSEQDSGRGIGVDNAGNVYVTGGFYGTGTFGSINKNSGGLQQFFLAKYDAGGNAQWVRQTTGGVDELYGTGLAVDGAGNSYAVVYAENGAPITFEGGPTLQTPDAQSFYTASTFLVKYDNTGTVQWARVISGDCQIFAIAVAVDTGGNVYLGGGFGLVHDDTRSPPVSMVIEGTTLVSMSRGNAFVAKFASTGALTWVRQAEAAGAGSKASISGVGVDQAGNVYIGGGFGIAAGDTASFGSSVFLTSVGGGIPSAGIGDAFLAKYNSAGTIQWARRAGGTGLDSYFGIALDAQGNVYAPGVLSPDAASPSGSGGAMVAKYDPTGALQWAYSASGATASPVPSIAAKVAVDSSGNCYLAGLYRTTTTFGTDVLQPQGYWNSFLAKIPPITYTITTSSSPTGGGSTSGGETFASGSSVTVVATPSSGYSFMNWTEGGSAVSTSASYSFFATADRTLVANFQLNSGSGAPKDTWTAYYSYAGTLYDYYVSIGSTNLAYAYYYLYYGYAEYNRYKAKGDIKHANASYWWFFGTFAYFYYVELGDYTSAIDAYNTYVAYAYAALK